VTFGCEVVCLLIDFLFVCLTFSKWFFVVVLQENFDELTWETYKGPLTEKQQKTIEKVHKRHEKMANLKKENDAIQAKEIGQGGLTQGQQTQMARNEQRIEQVEHTKISSSPLLFPSRIRCCAFVCFSMGRPR
jgi:biopolymer transport protein ExbB/TolQ